MRKIYAGIGARKTPPNVLETIQKAGRGLARLGFTLRSGAAEGADEAFERGAIEVGGNTEIYLPFPRFRGHPSELHTPTKQARLHASRFHPNWEVIGDRGRDFHGRNIYQVLGLDLETPADFVLCYTPEGEVVGGTGQALRVAAFYEIPVFNLGNQDVQEIEQQISEMIDAQESP